MNTLYNKMDCVLKVLPDELFDNSIKKDLLNLSNNLDEKSTNLIGFETLLDDNKNFDMSLRVYKTDYKYIKDFYDSEDYPFNIDQSNFLWMEFDSDKKEINNPGLHLSILNYDTDNVYNSNSLKDILRHYKDVIIFTGFFPNRNSEKIRITIHKDAAVDLLREFDWIGNIDELNNTCNYLSKYFDEILIDIDLSNTVGSRIGIECFIKDKLSTVNKLKEIFSQKDFKKFVNNEKLNFTNNLNKKYSSWNFNYSYEFNFLVNHVKFDFVENKITKAKLYFGAIFN